MILDWIFDDTTWIKTLMLDWERDSGIGIEHPNEEYQPPPPGTDEPALFMAWSLSAEPLEGQRMGNSRPLRTVAVIVDGYVQDRTGHELLYQKLRECAEFLQTQAGDRFPLVNLTTTMHGNIRRPSGETSGWYAAGMVLYFKVSGVANA